MAHSLILGMTESGKTTLARELAYLHKQSGWGVIVLDPMNDPRWACDFRTARVEEFLRVFWLSTRCMAFIDEASENVSRYDDAMLQTATKGRHFGHSCYYISQRGAQLSPTVRGQCRHLFLFAMSGDDCKVLANEFNQPELKEAASLPQLHYMHATRFGARIQRGALTPEVIA